MGKSENISSKFFESCARVPDKTALVYRGRIITYCGLEKDVKSTAAFFASRGIGKGDRVMVFVPMSLDLYRVVLALFYLGAVVVFLDEWVGVRRMEECCKIADARAYIGGWKMRIVSWFSKELRRIPVKLSLKYSKTNEDVHSAEVRYEDTALITFTTGSTGPPKAAKRTHGFLKEQFNALSEIIYPAENDTDMPTLPIVLLINLGMGCTSVIPDYKNTKAGMVNPGKIWDQIRKYKVNRITGSPDFIRNLSAFFIRNNVGNSGIVKIFTGGAPVFPDEAKKYIRAFPEALIQIVYGSTEAEPISVINATKLAVSQSTLLNVGLPYKSLEIKIIHIKKQPFNVNNTESLLELSLPQGEIGEIIVSGPHVLTEYFNSPEAFLQNKIISGTTIWHRTGDAGRINETGGLELAGRCSRIIFTEEKIYYPFIFEAACRKIEGIEIGTLLEIQGTVTAIIEKKSNAVEADIKQKFFLAYPDIKVIRYVQKIPMDQRHHSKIDYAMLEAMLKS